MSHVFWFTGLSGAGKSTVAEGVKRRLEQDGVKVLILDGDAIRKERHPHLDFSPESIRKNNAAIAGLCRERSRDHDVIFVAIISPYRDSRAAARNMLSPNFYEVYFCAGLDTVSERDVKGLYAKAKAGEIKGLIGYSPDSVYEPPQDPDCVVDSSAQAPEASIEQFYQFVRSKLKLS